MRKALGLSIVLHASAVLAACAAWLQTDLPRVPAFSWQPLDCYVPPPVLVTWRPGTFDVGARPEAVRAYFGDASAPNLRESLQGQYCWRYLFVGGRSFTLLFERGRVARRWLSDFKDVPQECLGDISRLVPLEMTSHAFWFGVASEPLADLCVPAI